MPAEPEKPEAAPEAPPVPDHKADADLPAPDTRLPHSEATDKDYDALEALRRQLSAQR